MPQLFYGQWVQQVSGTSETLNDVFAVTENLVFAVGNNGTILKTTDGGVNWVQKNWGVTFRLDKLQFVNENVGYIFGFEDSLYLGKLLMTLNGGETWSQITSLNINGEGDISVVNADIFYYSNNFILFKSINRGLSFQEINITNSIQKIQFITEMIGFASGYGGLLKTIDGGFTWGIISNSISSFYFLNQNIGFKASSDGLYKTIDGGISFIFVDWDISGMNKIYLSNENIVWGTPVKCPLNGNPCFSMRGETNNLGVIKRENDVTVYTAHSFVNPTLGFAVLWGGQIYKNTTGSLLINKLDKKKVFLGLHQIQQQTK